MSRECVKCGNVNFLTLESHLLIECEYVMRIKAYWNGKINAYCDNICNDIYDNFPIFNFDPLTSIHCGNDIFDFTICLECGWIVGLNLDQLKKNVQKVFDPNYLDRQPETNSSNSDISNSSNSDISNSSSSSMDDLEKLKIEVKKAKLFDKPDKYLDEFDYIKHTDIGVQGVCNNNTTIGNLVDELVNKKIQFIPKNIQELSKIIF